jgi:hypothetical protein
MLSLGVCHMTRYVIAAIIVASPAIVRSQTGSFAPIFQQSAHTDKTANNDPDFAVQGEYLGINADNQTFGLQVVATGRRGDNEFLATLFEGTGTVGNECGLPSLGKIGDTKVICHMSGRWLGKEVRLDDGEGPFTVTIRQGQAYYYDKTVHAGKVPCAVLQKRQRTSPTLGAKPPQHSTVLFDGKSTDAWINGVAKDNLLLGSEFRTKESFGDYTLHFEFQAPYEPSQRGDELLSPSCNNPSQSTIERAKKQGGVWHHGKYQVLIRDSFGCYERDRQCDGMVTDCGAISDIAKPKINAAFPPLTWQTYDAKFRAPRFDHNGKLVENARITIYLNGTLVHADHELK